MALLLAKERVVHFRLLGRGLLAHMSGLHSIYNTEFSLRNEQVLNTCFSRYQKSTVRWVSMAVKPERICWEGSSSEILLRKIENALREQQVEEAWEVFNDYKKLYGVPDRSVVSRLFMELSYSSDSRWLQKACDLVDIVKPHFLQPGFLLQLALSLARVQMPIPASKILRLMLEKENVPAMDVLGLVVLHMVKTDIGTHLASNILIEICDCFLCNTANKIRHAKIIKPDTMIFNLVLNACVKSRSSFKGQQLIDFMAKLGVVADAHTIVIIAQINEMNNQRDELRKFQEHIDPLVGFLPHHYWQFYDRLLNLHFKFGDLDAASELVLNLCGFKDRQCIQINKKELQMPCFVQIGSQNLGTGLKLQVIPDLLLKDSVLKLDHKQELFMYREGRLALSNRAVAKLIYAFKIGGKIRMLSKLVINIQRKLGSSEANLCYDVIDSCIHLGWLETAHDVLDDMELAGIPMGIGAYRLLLSAYSNKKMIREAKALLKQMRKAGLALNLSDEVLFSTCTSELDESNMYANASATGLSMSLIREMKEDERPPMIYKLDSSIYFFCKAKMIDDAMRAYRKILETNIQPTVQTFTNLALGYSSLEMYREMTILWGDIRRHMESGDLIPSRDMFEFFLLNFLRGGYFERVMETIRCMKEQNMFTDKQLYRVEFLKLHKDLYRNLKASRAKTDAQLKRLKFVQEFRRWVGIV